MIERGIHKDKAPNVSAITWSAGQRGGGKAGEIWAISQRPGMSGVGDRDL